MRVLLVTGRLGHGGTELAVMTLARGLAAGGRVRPRIAVLADGGSLATELRAEGIEVDELGLRGPIRDLDSLRRLWSLRRVVREERIDVVHTFLFEADVYGMLAAFLGGPRAIVTTRRAIKSHRPQHLLGYRLTNGLADRIVANSEAVRRFTLEAERAEPDRVVTIENGVDAARFRGGDRAVFRRRLGVEDDAILVGSLGTIKAVKGQDLLLDAAAPLFEEIGTLTLVLAGAVSPGFGEDLAERARSFGSRVILPGNVEDVPDYLAALDVFVLPSRSEGMSNALLEAMAAGLAIIATRVGGNEASLDGGGAGILVPADDPGALRAALTALVRDPERRQVLAEVAASRARTEYSLQRMFERTESLYRELLSR